MRDGDPGEAQRHPGDQGRLAAAREHADRLPGVFVKTRPVRRYDLGPTAAHVLGFVGAINPQEFGRWRDMDFRRTDLVGRDGIERYYDAYLRGRIAEGALHEGFIASPAN